MNNSTFFRYATTILVIVTLLVPVVAATDQAASGDAARILGALEVREGMTVCEMGAGDGELSVAAARVVGASGRVLTSELGDDRVKALREKIAASGLPQITIVAGDSNRTNFPDGACDALFMRNVYHHFADPPAMNASIAAALKPGGRLAIADFTPPPGSEAARPADRGKDGMHGITVPTLTKELTAAGFELVTSSSTDRAFMVVVAKQK